MNRRYPAALSILITFFILQACKTTRHVEEGNYLLRKNDIHLNPEGKIKSEVSKEELESVLRQKPNRRIAGFIPFHISVWNFAHSREIRIQKRTESRKEKGKRERKNKHKFNSFLKNTVGEEPVTYEPALLEKSREQLALYLKNHGYFDAIVTADDSLKRKKAKLHFTVQTGEAYRLRKLGYGFEDTAMVKELRNGVYSSLTRGTRFETDVLDDERQRITNLMKNRGYFTFEKIHVVFDVDTNLSGPRYDVKVRLRNQRVPSVVNGVDTIQEERHKRHKISRVVINQNYEASRSGNQSLDSIHYEGYEILFRGKPYVRPERLLQTIFVSPGDYYSKDKTQYTYDRINALNNFRFIDIRYEPSEDVDGQPGLDMVINLTRSARQAVSLETGVTNRSGNLGVSVSTNYKNKNMFRGAEQLDWRIYGGLEAQRTNSTIDNEEAQVIEFTPFNTYEVGTQIGITIPDFIFSSTRSSLPWFKEPRTTVSLAVDRQVRPQYDRNLFNASYQISMRIREKDQLIVAPVDISVIQLNKTPQFERQLLATGNSLLINSYNNHIIPAGRISYSNTTQDFSNELKNYHYYRTNFEASGNILRALSGPVGLPYDPDRNSYLIDSIAYAQYVKFDFDFRQYFVLTENTQSVFRFFGGIGIPFQNLNTLPFERSFFAGGANDIRAWQARGLGPGSLADTATYGIDQVGDLQLEVNLEYRFKLVKQLEGALFTDVGNIWILGEDPLRPGAEFNPNDFYREIAIAPGAGVRLNLNFFVLRFDVGFQLKDPALPQGERWAWVQPKTLTNQYRQDAQIKNSDGEIEEWKPEFTFNLAINYPF